MKIKKHTLARIIILSTTLILTAVLLSVALFSGRVAAKITQENGNYYLDVKTSYLFDSIGDRKFITDYDISFWAADENFDRGKGSGGISSLRIKSGDYSGGSLIDKSYRLHSYSSVKCVIVLQKKSGGSSSIFVFNLKSEKKTKEFYQLLSQI